ncbi:MAG: PilZ domain-containing protein [Pseudomonadota bacterium]
MSEDITSIRRHARQISQIPAEVTLNLDNRLHTEIDEVTNISLGGMCFVAEEKFDISEAIQIRFPALQQGQALNGEVVWCNKLINGYEIGLRFDDPAEVERLKTVDQIIEIENYREKLERQEGRTLTSEQAATEWIKQYAGEFSALS